MIVTKMEEVQHCYCDICGTDITGKNKGQSTRNGVTLHSCQSDPTKVCIDVLALLAEAPEKELRILLDSTQRVLKADTVNKLKKKLDSSEELNLLTTASDSLTDIAYGYPEVFVALNLKAVLSAINKRAIALTKTRE